MAGTASANSVIATSGEPSEPAYHQLDGRVGMLLGGADVGDADGFSVGLSLGMGYRINDITLRGSFDYYKTGDGDDETLHRKGRGARLGGAVRYSFAQTEHNSGFNADFWGEVGVGYEHVDWRQGGVLDRPSAELAFGFDLGGRTDADRYGRRREAGYYMALRGFLAGAPEQSGAMATCGGPCDAATTPSRLDLSMFFDFGLHFGR